MSTRLDCMVYVTAIAQRRQLIQHRVANRGHPEPGIPHPGRAARQTRQIRAVERLTDFSADPPKRDEGHRCASDGQHQARPEHGAIDVGARTDARLFRRATAGVQGASAVEEDVGTCVRNVQVRGVGNDQDDNTDHQES